MTLLGLHPTIKEAMCLFEAFRRVGYPSDDIFLIYGYDAEHKPCLFIEARWKGETFTMCAGEWHDDPDGLVSQWEEATGLWNGGGVHTEDHTTLWESSWILRNSLKFVTALTEQGMLRSVSTGGELFMAQQADA